MRIKSLTKPTFRTYTFSFDKQGDLSEHNFNLVMSDGEIRGGAMVKKLNISIPDGVSARKIFHVAGKYFVQSTDNELYLFNAENVWERIAEVGNNLYLVECSVGESRLLAVGFDGGSFFINGEGTVIEADLPDGTCATFYAGMLFVANENKLNFSKLLSVDDFSVGLGGGFVMTEAEDGEILALLPNENCLVIFCEKCVYELTAVGERSDYKLKRQDISVVAQRGSIGRAGDKILFIDNGKLCYYNNGGVVPIACAVLDEDYYFDGQSTVSGSVYVAKIRKLSNRMKCILYFDANSCVSTLVGLNISQTADGGILLSGTQFYGLSEKNSLNNDFFWESKLLDLGFSGKKDMLYFGAYSEGEVKVSIIGDTVKRTFKLKKGYNERLLNIPSYGFTLNFSASGSSFKVKDIKIKYRIRGE